MKQAQENGTSSRNVTLGGFLWRFGAALLLVIATYNPSGVSAYHWIADAFTSSSFGPLHLLSLGILLAGWSIYWIATWRALGSLGVVLISIVLAALVWFLFDIGLLEDRSLDAISWILLICVAVVLSVGVTWSHVWRRLTGQYNVQDADD